MTMNKASRRRIAWAPFLSCLLALLCSSPASGQGGEENEPEGPAIQNPYYPSAKWRVWRDDPSPLENVGTMVKQGKEKKSVTMTLAPTQVGKRIYPSGPLREGRPIKWVTLARPSKKYAGCWDDVYASWSGLHGYVRSAWKNKDGSEVTIRPKGLDHIMHFVELQKLEDLLRCGINFVHQSTTGMCHTITNGYDPKMTETYEKVYFSDCLVTAPAHASYTEEWPDRTKDLILAHVPTLFNSVGSSNSETMAITKMMIVGGYLPPATKLTLKRNGLYPSALLYIWRASLPIDVPYDHELKQRVAYRALGDERQFPGKYGHAGGERGNLALAYHRYDEIAHMRNMIRMAEAMKDAPPEAVFDEMKVEGGKTVYLLKKAALILQEKDQEISVTVSSARCYDLASKPLTVRWKLLYGTRTTTCVPGEKPHTWTLKIPWDEALPEGRTAIALIANNGIHDGNPAVITVFRKRMDLPPNGGGYKGYGYDSPHANRKPVLLGLQDQVARSGKTLRIELNAMDPEGRPVRFFKRTGDPGTLEGNVYTVKMPRKRRGQPIQTTIIASDGTAGNSYAAKTLTLATAAHAHARIEAKSFMGPAPFTFKASTKGSLPRRGAQVGWEFYTPGKKRKPGDWKKLVKKARVSHTFDKPGLYEVALTVKSGKHTDRETVKVWVTDEARPAPQGGVMLEGNGVRISNGDDAPCAFDHTHFGTVKPEGKRIHRYMLFNQGKSKISGSTVALSGPHAGDFKVVTAPGRQISPRGCTPFAIQFSPKEEGLRKAEVSVKSGSQTIRFSIAGTCDVK